MVSGTVLVSWDSGTVLDSTCQQCMYPSTLTFNDTLPRLLGVMQYRGPSVRSHALGQVERCSAHAESKSMEGARASRTNLTLVGDESSTECDSFAPVSAASSRVYCRSSTAHQTHSHNRCIYLWADSASEP